MKRKYFLRKAINRALFARVLAKGIDLFIVLILSVFFYPIGLILSMVYVAFSDSMQNGQSVGKRYMGFQVISLEDGKACSLKQSVVRNIPLLVPLGLAVIPVAGAVLAMIVGTFLLVLEAFFLFKLDSGHRLGDVMADTTVMGNGGNHILEKEHKETSWFSETGAPMC